MRKLRRLLIQYLTKHLLRTLTPDDVLQITSKGWFLHKRKLSEEEVADIKDAAKMFETSILWDLMRKDIEYTAFVTGRKAKTDEQNLACHYMFYNLDLLEQYLRNCRKL